MVGVAAGVIGNSLGDSATISDGRSDGARTRARVDILGSFVVWGRSIFLGVDSRSFRGCLEADEGRVFLMSLLGKILDLVGLFLFELFELKSGKYSRFKIKEIEFGKYFKV